MSWRCLGDTQKEARRAFDRPPRVDDPHKERREIEPPEIALLAIARGAGYGCCGFRKGRQNWRSFGLGSGVRVT